MPLSPDHLSELEALVGRDWVKHDPASLEVYGHDALKKAGRPDGVVWPGSTAEVASVVRWSGRTGTPLVPRGAGTGYTGGAVPVRGGVVMSLERLNRILEIDEVNLLAVVQPHVVTADLQRASEAVGLFYPPDPASLEQSVIGGNVAECAGGPRAFKYGTTKRYVLGLEAVLPTGEIIRTGSKAVKNVVGYDLTQLLVGSEGTLAIITEVVLRLVPRPAAHATLNASFASVDHAVDAVTRLLQARVVPATMELVDEVCLRAVQANLGESLAPPGSLAVLLIEVDGSRAAVEEDAALVASACRAAGASEVRRAASDAEDHALWRLRREISPSLARLAPLKINHDVVVPRGRVPELFECVDRMRRELGLTIACFGHAGDGNIHVNLLLDPADSTALAKARGAERELFEQVVALEGSISGEHGIGFTKAPYLGIELSAETIALMKRVKAAFDPNGILNPGKIFPDEE